MTSHKETILELWIAVNRDGPEAMRRYLSPDYLRHGSDRDYGADDWLEVLADRQNAFSDNTTSVDDFVIEGDRVAYRWHAEGTHTGTYLRIPPTGKRVRAGGLTLLRFEQGLIREEWASWNKTTVLHVLGVMPII
ncbi:MAG: ester cyclase [Rhodobacteraceae bacterium]|jgi:steroid delta-isomerase-like uncharacterized protein|nr:ester cyclase [Paracoccaceae bacterium]